MMSRNRGSVLFVASVYSHLKTFHVPYMKLLSSWGYDIFVAASGGFFLEEKVELELLGFQCIDIPFERTPFSKSTLFAYRKVCSLLAANYDIKLIHVHTPTAAFITRKAVASVACSSTVLYTAHGFHFHKGSSLRNWMTYYWAEKCAARLTDGLITINEEDYEVAKGFRLRAGGQVYYVPGVGVDLSIYYPGSEQERKQVRTNLGVNLEDVVFVYVAELNHNKNQRQFLQAFHDAFPSGGDASVKAWIVGDGPMRGEMETLAVRLGIDSRVFFLGERRDVPLLLRGADVGVLLSHREGLPRSLMEMSATGLPVIATNIRGNRDIVRNGVNGILVELGNVKATTSALRKLAMEPRSRESMGARGRERMRMFSLDEVIPQMAKIYRHWLHQRRR